MSALAVVASVQLFPQGQPAPREGPRPQHMRNCSLGTVEFGVERICKQ